jgi:hypothetical protein
MGLLEGLIVGKASFEEWERQGLIPTIWELRREKWSAQCENASKRIVDNCNRYRLLPWWNPFKWLALIEIHWCRWDGKRLLAKHDRLADEGRNVTK